MNTHFTLTPAEVKVVDVLSAEASCVAMDATARIEEIRKEAEAEVERINAQIKAVVGQAVRDRGIEGNPYYHEFDFAKFEEDRTVSVFVFDRATFFQIKAGLVRPGEDKASVDLAVEKPGSLAVN
jgi:hypothetical protein